jgi:hypothetical protein
VRLTTLLASLALVSGSAVAADAPQPVKVDPTIVLHDGRGKPIKDYTEAVTDGKSVPDCSKCSDWTVGKQLSKSLGDHTVDPSVKWGTTAEKWAVQLLADKFMGTEPVILHPKDQLLIEEAIKPLPGIIIEQLMPMIDPSAAAPEVK